MSYPRESGLSLLALGVRGVAKSNPTCHGGASKLMSIRVNEYPPSHLSSGRRCNFEEAL
jgi:hypothetical protein